jgi:ABC-type uncharacterized transport system auxiliary subunit
LIKQPAPVIAYYQLEYAPPAARSTNVSATLMIAPLRIAPEYDRDTLVYRDEAYRAGFYLNDQWMANPARQLTEKLVRDFQATRLFAGVFTAGTFQKPDYVLHGTIRELGEQRAPDARFGSVAIAFTLTHAAGSGAPQIVFQRTYEQRVPCKDKTVNALVEAIGAAMHGVVCEVVDEVDSAVSTAH